jgi:hypothetical protein
MVDRLTAVKLMNEECAEAGCMADFRAVPTLMAEGSPEAEKVWKSKTFQQRWKYYVDSTWEIAGEPRSKMPMLRLTAFPIISDTPSSPNVDLYLRSGLVAGLALGGLTGYRRSLKIKVSRESKDLGSVVVPAYEEVDPPPLPGSPEALKRRHSPEDDW